MSSYKYREELVGKRFLSVSGGLNKLKLNKISDWGWRAGVIRASSHRDNKHPELQVLVEYDDVEWQRREWLSLHKGRVFHAFLVEQSLVWATRNNKPWPALTFSALVDNAQISEATSRPIEYLSDRELAFRQDVKDYLPFQDWDSAPANAPCDDSSLRASVRRWSEFQNGQSIFLSTPSVLVGYRVEVYRAEGTTQWYTAVIVAYNESTSDLTVTDDTVLEEHNEDPRLVQMRLIGDGVVESIMRGDNVGITPRRSRSAAAAANLALQSPCRSPRVTTAPASSPGGRNNHTPPAATSSTAPNPTPSPRPQRAAAAKPSTESTAEKDRGSTNNGAQNVPNLRVGSRRRKGSSGCTPPVTPPVVTPSPPTPRVQTPPVKTPPTIVTPSPPPSNKVEIKDTEIKKSVVVPPISPPVLVKVNNIINKTESNIIEKKLNNKTIDVILEEEEEEEIIEVARVKNTPDKPLLQQRSSDLDKRIPPPPPSTTSVPSLIVNKVIVNSITNVPTTTNIVTTKLSTTTTPVQVVNASKVVFSENDVKKTMLQQSHHQQQSGEQQQQQQHHGQQRILLDSSSHIGGLSSNQQQHSVTILPTSASSDSGVGSLRSSSSSDERSASASSSSRSSETGSATGSSNNNSTGSNPNNLGAPTSGEPIRVWRDPTLVQASEPLVRHIHSVQHHHLMPHHPPSSSAPPNVGGERVVSGAPPQGGVNRGPSPHYPPPPSPMMSPHPPMAGLHPHLLAPQMYGQIPDMQLWKQRYLAPPSGSAQQQSAAQHAAEEMLERERAFAQDRDRQERFLRERREQEARERAAAEREQRERAQAHAERAERLALEQQQQVERERIAVEQQQAAERLAERERLEKQRAEQAVHKHFEESLRLAQHKRNMGAGWNMLNTLPPPSRADEEARKAQAAQQAAQQAHQQQQQRLMLAERQRQEARERAYYGSAPPSAPQPSAPSQVSSRKDFPPPPAAHSRAPSKHPSSSLPPQESKLPKVEPNFNMYGYPAYQPVGLLATADNMGKVKQELPNPPPLLSESKSSVIVKNEPKSPAQSPKLTYQPYPPRAPTPQNLASKQHLASPPDGRQVLYPTGLPFATAGKGSAVAYPYTTAPPQNNPGMYGPPSQLNKPKVSSPAPPRIYGKPTAVLGPPPPSHHHPREAPSPLPLTSKAQAYIPGPPPPPAHTSSRHPPPMDHREHARVMEHARMYPQGPPAPPSPALGVTPSARASPHQMIQPPRQTPSICQTQPLDLGTCRDANSPKRSAPSPDSMRKRRPIMEPSIMIQQSNAPPPAQLSRVSEPSPLIASAATTITTVENTAVSGGVIQRSHQPTVTTTAAPTVPAVTKPPSPPPKQTPTYQGHKLKKAWLQRHSGEDVTEQRCVTPVTPSPSPAPGSPANREPAAAPVPASPPQPVTPKGKLAAAKSALAAAAAVRKAAASPVILQVNGHADSPAGVDASSSSSDEVTPAQRKSPAKRKPKVKRRKGAKKAALQDAKRMKVPSESASDSEKESGTEKDSEDSVGSTSGRKPAVVAAAGIKETPSGNSTTTSTTAATPGNGGKKRGRRPKSKNDEPRPPKKPRGGNDGDGSPTPPSRDPMRKPPVSQLKKSGESFLQDGYCFEVAPKLAKCRECRLTQNQRNKNMMNNIFCRFYYFRRLRYTKNGQLAIAGFSDPYTDASEDDVRLWMPDSTPSDLEPEMARFLLSQVGDQFCDLIQQETEAQEVNMAKDKKIVWKRVVQKVREMCDVCETTLFNFHWACDKCGFVVCIDCYKGRKNGACKMWGDAGKDRDDFSWLLCTNRAGHEQERLMLTQIIAGDALSALGKKMHEARSQWSIPQLCACPLSKELAAQPRPNGMCKDLVRVKGEVNGLVREKRNGANTTSGANNGSSGANSGNKEEASMSPLSWLADVALSNEDKKGEDSNSSDSDDSSKEGGNYSTLRELLIRPSHKPSGGGSAGSTRSGSTSPSSTTPAAPSTSTVPSKVSPNPSPAPAKPEPEEVEVKPPVVVKTEEVEEVAKEVPRIELKNFVRRKVYRSSGVKQLPLRVMTHLTSREQYPDVPHQWQCDGRLLILQESANPNNYKLFQDQWKRGQPVMVLGVSSQLQKDLWHPERFAQDFGEEKADLINCMSGHIVPNTAMRLFWEGFESHAKRLKDKQGVSMLLKLKDWPPGEDFSDILPAHMTDLMNALPLGEYTQRTGRLNIASRLPECFVRPDLGPKMYNAYGSALHPDKGTTNLHLDISDAVNVMVYAGSPKDVDNEENMKAALRSVDEAGCDILTRRRVREKGVVPGALWHIYNARDADCIRDLLNIVSLERGERLEPHHDPIHDQSWYLDGPLRERLYKEYNVEGYAIVQCLGDAIFIPAGAPHQVRNLHNCIKVAEDFVSPENVSHCFHLTQEFRDLSDTHTNHEDKLQIKNIMYHAVKDSLAVLSAQASKEQADVKVKPEPVDKVDNGDVKQTPEPSSGATSQQASSTPPQSSTPSTTTNNSSETKSNGKDVVAVSNNATSTTPTVTEGKKETTTTSNNASSSSSNSNSSS